MSVREKISQSKFGGLAAAIGLLAAAVLIVAWTNADWFHGPMSKAYFSVDDGKTYFADSVNKVPPFESNGKEAVQVFVFRAGSNPPFVGYLQTYKPETARKIRDLLATGATGEGSMELMNARSAALVKRPGEAKWQPVTSSEGARVVTIAPPAGQTGELRSVEP